MSIPISICEAHKAAKGDEEAYQSLLKKMRENLKFGSYSTFGCDCDPPCESTEEQFEALNARLAEDCTGYAISENCPPGEPGEPGHA